jgi:hypothetical protein
MFFEEPRVLMGLNPKNRVVIRSTAADQEARYQAYAHAYDEKKVLSGSTEHIEST